MVLWSTLESWSLTWPMRLILLHLNKFVCLNTNVVRNLSETVNTENRFCTQTYYGNRAYN